MRAGANILSPISVNQKYPPGTVVDYAYSVFYQVSSYNPTELQYGSPGASFKILVAILKSAFLLNSWLRLFDGWITLSAG